MQKLAKPWKVVSQPIHDVVEHHHNGHVPQVTRDPRGISGDAVRAEFAQKIQEEQIAARSHANLALGHHAQKLAEPLVLECSTNEYLYHRQCRINLTRQVESDQGGQGCSDILMVRTHVWCALIGSGQANRHSSLEGCSLARSYKQPAGSIGLSKWQVKPTSRERCKLCCWSDPTRPTMTLFLPQGCSRMRRQAVPPSSLGI